LGRNGPVFRAGSTRTSYVLLLSGSVLVPVIGEGGRKAAPSQVLPGQCRARRPAAFFGRCLFGREGIR